MYSSRRGANYLTEICVQVRQIRLHVIRTIYKKTGDALYMKDFRRYPVLEALRILAYTAYRSSSPQGGGLFRVLYFRLCDVLGGRMHSARGECRILVWSFVVQSLSHM